MAHRYRALPEFVDTKRGSNALGDEVDHTGVEES